MKFYRDLQTQEHTALAVVKNVELRKLLTDIIAGDKVAVSTAVVQQFPGIGDLTVEIVQLDAGVHTAFQHAHIIPIVL